ncbi:AraC family transcriptional regulator [Paenibacillus lemnae]|uniref:Helix-turn-helix transcriptional regulator n=1 Tax=Paenibacillus lemnae TaxID=1330551 RepID=A0A848M217_PAELE|nr:AraC family transcriptional regulator [Paenibacillus lemnae]NMO94606.1 helix-turn-helix transcriptional regulator [Paenibacillus lemnae]
MDKEKTRSQLIEMYLASLNVNVTAMGFNRVGQDWREMNYRPDYNKFYLIMDGEGWLQIGDQELCPKPGQMVLMPEGITQSYSTTVAQDYTKYWCHFTAKVGSLNLFDLIQIPWLLDLGDDLDKPVSFFQDMLQEQRSKHLSASLNMKSSLLRLIGCYLDRASQVKLQNPHSETSTILQATLSYIDDHYHRNITVLELAELSHLHPNSLIRLFKKHLGTSPIQYVNRKRVQQIKWLLATTDLSLAEIGEQSGIPDVSYLSKAFKSATGFSPTAYKMMLQTAE